MITSEINDGKNYTLSLVYSTDLFGFDNFRVPKRKQELRHMCFLAIIVVVALVALLVVLPIAAVNSEHIAKWHLHVAVKAAHECEALR